MTVSYSIPLHNKSRGLALGRVGWPAYPAYHWRAYTHSHAGADGDARGIPTGQARRRGRSSSGRSNRSAVPSAPRERRTPRLRGHGSSAVAGRESLRRNWLRVSRSAEASRMGQGGRQPRHTRAVRSEKCVSSAAERRTGMRVVIVFFGPYAPYALISYVSAFPHFFKRLDRFAKLATSSVL